MLICYGAAGAEVSKVRVVEDVESFRPKLQAYAFTKVKDLGHGEINTLGRGTINGAARRIANGIA